MRQAVIRGDECHSIKKIDTIRQTYLLIYLFYCQRLSYLLAANHGKIGDPNPHVIFSLGNFFSKDTRYDLLTVV